MLRGIDISEWQRSTPDLSDLDFVVLRASIGVKGDGRYNQHFNNARSAGVVVGAYHFNDDRLSIEDQVTVFLDVSYGADFRALDVEGGNEFSDAQAKTFIRLCHEAGYKIGLYHSHSGYPRNLGQDWDWVADWTGHSPSDIDWEMWQYRGSPLDLDVFKGSLSDLLALGDSMSNAVNCTSRIVSSDYVRAVRAGTIAYADTNGTKLTTMSKDAVLDDFGIPVNAAGWCYLRISSANFDTDSAQEYGLALFKTAQVGSLIRKDDAALKATSERYFIQPVPECPPDIDGAYNDGLKAAQEAVLAVPPMLPPVE